MIRHSDLLFHTSTKQTFKEITQTFDFLWPTAAAMWNLRWQVNGYLAVRPDASVPELENRFVAGSGIHGVNLFQSCVSQDWGSQQEQFAKFLLINLCAHYESWLHIIVEALGPAQDTQQIVKDLQFPDRWLTSIHKLQKFKSPMMEQSIYPALKAHRKNSRSEIEALLKCYRYFKECRNTLAHQGGIATDHTEKIFNQFKQVATTNDLGLKEVPLHEPIVAGKAVKVHLRGIVGLCDVLFRIIATTDAELACLSSAENHLIDRIKISLKGRIFSISQNDANKRKKSINGILASASLPILTDTTSLESYLVSKALIRYG